jgi:hypothetical protein
MSTFLKTVAQKTDTLDMNEQNVLKMSAAILAIAGCVASFFVLAPALLLLATALCLYALSLVPESALGTPKPAFGKRQGAFDDYKSWSHYHDYLTLPTEPELTPIPAPIPTLSVINGGSKESTLTVVHDAVQRPQLRVLDND